MWQLLTSTTKKIIVRRFDRESIPGFVNLATYLQPDFVELLLVSGVAQRVPFTEIKSVAFVKDFDAPRGQPEAKSFQSRPKIEGLWVRMRFRDGELTEGLLANNLAQTDTQGFQVTPPNSSGNVQRLFVPRVALEEMVVLAVVGGKSSRNKPKESQEQIGLFGDAG
ncbi:MAG: hypothetical protein IT169_11385 [Bryobacterales bacterium]|nr:hypothetical protein [Bryobacterales bacterium]